VRGVLPSALPPRSGASSPTPNGFTSALIGAIMGDARDRLPVVMLINGAIQSVCSSSPRADDDMKGAGMRRMDLTFLAITAIAMVTVGTLLAVWLMI